MNLVDRCETVVSRRWSRVDLPHLSCTSYIVWGSTIYRMLGLCGGVFRRGGHGGSIGSERYSSRRHGMVSIL
jgi:hypothetical protein